MIDVQLNTLNYVHKLRMVKRWRFGYLSVLVRDWHGQLLGRTQSASPGHSAKRLHQGRASWWPRDIAWRLGTQRLKWIGFREDRPGNPSVSSQKMIKKIGLSWGSSFFSFQIYLQTPGGNQYPGVVNIGYRWIYLQNWMVNTKRKQSLFLCEYNFEPHPHCEKAM